MELINTDLLITDLHKRTSMEKWYKMHRQVDTVQHSKFQHQLTHHCSSWEFWASCLVSSSKLKCPVGWCWRTRAANSKERKKVNDEWGSLRSRHRQPSVCKAASPSLLVERLQNVGVDPPLIFLNKTLAGSELKTCCQDNCGNLTIPKVQGLTQQSQHHTVPETWLLNRSSGRTTTNVLAASTAHGPTPSSVEGSKCPPTVSRRSRKRCQGTQSLRFPWP